MAQKRYIRVALVGALLNGCSLNVVGGTISNQINLNAQAGTYLHPQAASAIDRTELIVYSQDLSKLKQDFGGLVIETDAFNQSALLRAQGQWTTRLLMQQLQASDYVEYAEPNIQADLSRNGLSVKFEPNDALLSMASVRYPLELLKAYETWEMTQGKPDVTVAVADTGVDVSHPDLAGRLVPGFDFVNEDAAPDDDHGHGTHVAGIIAANIHNGLGISGLAPKVRIMPLKVLNQDKGGKFRNTARAIRWATEKGVDVINLSLAGSADNNDLRTAIQDALKQGVIVVAAMGNDEGKQPKYPAVYSDMGLISVGAVDSQQRRPSFSNYGAWLSVMAPGQGIVSTTPRNNREGPCLPGVGNTCYTSIDGTSQSAPYVAALAALMRSQQPEWSPAQVKAAIEETALDLGAGGVDEEYGHGLIQPPAALRRAGGQTQTPEPESVRIERVSASPFFIRSGDKVRLRLQTSGIQPERYGWAAAGGEILGTGPEVEWTAPEAGAYQIIAGVQAGEQPVFAAASVIVFDADE